MKLLGFLVLALWGAACTSLPSATPSTDPTLVPSETAVAAYPPAPSVPQGALDTAVERAARALVSAEVGFGVDAKTLAEVAGGGDARLAWVLADLLRFAPDVDTEQQLVAAFERLTATETNGDGIRSTWVTITDRLIAWDLPAPPGYRVLKRNLFTQVEPAWAPFFDDDDADIDWRLLSWGGVFIDDRPSGSKDSCPRGCIPALDDPGLTDAGGGAWYPDHYVVFGVEVDGEAVAFPRNIMEVHEMVNMTIASRRVGIPYCTLCGSAQAYLTDAVPADVRTPVLRTSGLLARSNKVMYDVVTQSVFDTFTGRALSGPLQDAALELEQIPVVTTTWGAWKQAHPQTRILAEDGGIGRTYERDPLEGRDDSGPIFPVGPVDPRLPVQAKVLGVVSEDGTPVAFAVDQARAALESGRAVTAEGITVVADAGGLRAHDAQGDLASHEAFWFAWSQFHPTTLVWSAAD